MAKQLGKRLLIGGLAGLIASIPMAGVMMGLDRVLPKKKRSLTDVLHPLPPKLITRRLSLWSQMGQTTRPGKQWDLATWLGHLGYGAATASLFPVISRRLPIPAALRGILFAMGVWTASYMGWLPALGILPPANQQTPRRNAIMILSHMSWGTGIGLLTKWLNQKV